MYPPRRSGDSNSKPKTGYVAGSYSSPTHKDTNKINKILENAKKYQQVKEYKRDYMLQGIMSLKKNPGEEEGTSTKRRRQSEASNNSDKGDDYKKDIYRRIDASDAAVQTIARSANPQKIEANSPRDNPSREIKRNDGTGSYKNIEALGNFHTDQHVKKQYPAPQTSNIQVSQLNRHSSSNSLLDRNNGTSGSTYAYQYKSNSNNSNSYQYQPPTSTNVQPAPLELPKNMTETALVQDNNRESKLTKANIAISQSPPLKNQEQLSRIASDSQLHRWSSENTTLAKQSLPVKNQIRKADNQISSPRDDNRQSQTVFHSNLLNQNTQAEVKSSIGSENRKVQSLIKANYQIEGQNEQKNYIKLQMDKLTQQVIEVRDKYYKGEEEKNILKEKYRILQAQNRAIRNQNEQLKLRVKNVEFEISSLQNSKSLYENQMKQLKSNKQLVYDDLMGKMNELNIQFRKKAMEVTNLERTCSDLENKINENNYEIRRMNEVIGKKDEEVLQLQEKIYQHNRLSSAQAKTQSEIKKYAQKVCALEVENSLLKQQKGSSLKLEEELTKYRIQIQEMLHDMKDLQGQLESKNKIIEEYKSGLNQGSENQNLKMVEHELELIMKQKSELVKTYEQKLLQKDKIISELEIKAQPDYRQTKLIGLQSGEGSFEEILRKQVEDLNMVKRENTQKINEIFRLKLEMENVRSQLQDQKNKNKILSLQLEAKERNSNSVTQSHLRAARNEIQSLQRRMENMTSTIESKRRQNQNKDEFIKQYLLGISRQNDAGVVLAKLELLLRG